MVEEYATWRAHDHVVLGESNRRSKGCVYVQCGHDQVVCNMTCSWSCNTRQTNRQSEEMCWSPMWAWSTKYANGLSDSLYYVQQDHLVLTFILIDISLEDGPVWYTLEQRNFLVNYRYKRRFPFPDPRAPTTHYIHLYGFIQWRVTRANPQSPHLLSPHLRHNPFVWFRRCRRHRL
jgi:hypothetical protein